MSGFDRLDASIQHHIVNDLGWSSLRPLQELAIDPLLDGQDALLLAPTAGGKTEAALFPILTRMVQKDWQGTSVLYITPLKALINNVQIRADHYAQWLGRSAAARHGDTTDGERKRLQVYQPEILLTTPESLEAMLLSKKTDPKRLFAGLQAVIIDEIHAFAGDDRGWHLQGVLQRLSDLVGHPLQRIGLSATVGNAEWLLGWLQADNRRAGLPGVLVQPPVGAGNDPDIQLDYVGSIPNAAKVIASLHRGEKRLVFCESRRQVEALAERLRFLEVDTYVSHSSVAPDERKRAELAFSEGRDCVIVATSTLELGIDVGDLDRVIQLGGTRTVASLLQRLGRTGRRPGSRRNLLVLGIDDEDFLRAAGIVLLWSEGYVEPLVPPPEPLHILAQQALGIVIQEGAIGEVELCSRLSSLHWCDPALLMRIVQGLEELGHLHRDGDLLFVGPEAERCYGRMYFRDLMAVFTAPPQFLVLHGREEIGNVDPLALLRKVEGPRFITLGGRPWHITHIDWQRRRAFVEPSDQGGVVRWSNTPVGDSAALCDAMRRILLGAEPVGVRQTRRARAALARLRDERQDTVDETSTRVVGDETRNRWWTWAGTKRNFVYVTALDDVAPQLLAESRSFGNGWIALEPGVTLAMIHEAMRQAHAQHGENLEHVVPPVSEDAVRGLKFSELLPDVLACWTLGQRSISV